MAPEYITYHIRKVPDLFEVYEIALKKGNSEKSKTEPIPVFGSIFQVIGEIMHSYEQNNGNHSLKIDLSDELMRDSKLVNLIANVESFTNRKNGHNTR